MADAIPPELARLLAAPDARAREAAWGDFVAMHSRLLLHAAHERAADRDAAMDAYLWVLDRLREDDCRRLRGYAADPGARFTTWLVVVTRRLCIDHERHRYGRPRGRADDAERADEHRTRRRLVDLAGAEVFLDGLRDDTSDDPEARLRAEELRQALDAAMAALDPRDRLLLTLRFVDGLPAAQIATVQGWPSPFHVYRRLNHLFAELRRQLVRRGVEDAVP